MKVLFKSIAESELVLGAAVVLIGLAFFYLRNGSEYLSGKSGGAYWDNMSYCETHRDSQMKIYKELVSCQKILAHREYCKKDLDKGITIDGSKIPCDRFLGMEDDYSPYDAY